MIETNVVHIHPTDDVVAHDTDSDEANCICGPDTLPVERDDGSIGYLIVHHSLDGREIHEW